MKEISISKFKATCLAVIEEVERTREPVLVTRFGRPMAELSPPRKAAPGFLGALREGTKILGDIVSPATEEGDWEALRD